MTQSEPHPSEMLDFATIAGQSGLRSVFQTQHIEYAQTHAAKDLKSNEEHPISGIDDELQRLTRINSLIHTSTTGIEAEHQLTIKNALILYPKAILWSMLLSHGGP